MARGSSYYFPESSFGLSPGIRLVYICVLNFTLLRKAHILKEYKYLTVPGLSNANMDADVS